MPSARPDAMAPASGDLFDPLSRLARPRTRRAPLPWTAVLLVAAGVALLLWGAWITRAVLGAGARRPAFASVRLQPLVAEYVEAQARTRSSEEQVTRETRAFMVRLDAEIAARGRAGTTVLVAEAVLSKDVPDITDEVRRAVRAAAPPRSAAAGGERARTR